jgi:hypothetical protein
VSCRDRRIYAKETWCLTLGGCDVCANGDVWFSGILIFQAQSRLGQWYFGRHGPSVHGHIYTIKNYVEHRSGIHSCQCYLENRRNVNSGCIEQHKTGVLVCTGVIYI